MNNFSKLNPNYTEWLRERNRSQGSIQTYCQYLETFWQKQGTINTDSIRNFLKANIARYSPNSLKVFRYALSSYAKFSQIAIDWERITGIIPKMAKRFFSILTLSELEQLKQARVERNKATYERNNLIFDFLFYSGVRVNELVNIRHGNWQGKSLKVHGKGNKVRQVFLPPFLTNYLQENCNDYLFTNQKKQPLYPLVIRQIISQRLKKAGIDKNITPHSFRRSFATLLHNKGVKLTTIQKLLGHDSITTTERYIQNDYDSLFADYSKLWKPTENYALQK